MGNCADQDEVIAGFEGSFYWIKNHHLYLPLEALGDKPHSLPVNEVELIERMVTETVAGKGRVKRKIFIQIDGQEYELGGRYASELKFAVENAQMIWEEQRVLAQVFDQIHTLGSGEEVSVEAIRTHLGTLKGLRYLDSADVESAIMSIEKTYPEFYYNKSSHSLKRK